MLLRPNFVKLRAVNSTSKSLAIFLILIGFILKSASCSPLALLDNDENEISAENTDEGSAKETVSSVEERIPVPGKPLTPDEFEKAKKTKPKHKNSENDPTEEDIIEARSASKGSRQKDNAEIWENGIIPYLIDNEFDEDQRVDLARAVQEFEEQTCVQFVPADLEKDDDYLFIENIDEGCKSPIGLKGGRQSIKLADNCFDQFGRILHEMLHTIGFVHEQSRVDRDKYVFVDYDVIREEFEHNFEKREPPAGNYAGEYDTRSILHYSASAFADPKHEITIYPYFDEVDNLGQREGFSKMDVMKVNKWYKCKSSTAASGSSSSNTEKAHDKLKKIDKHRLHRFINSKCYNDTKCVDKTEACPLFAKMNHCVEKEEWMADNCKKSCNKCGAACKDSHDKCAEWADLGYCSQYDDFMLPYCSRSCKSYILLLRTLL